MKNKDIETINTKEQPVLHNDTAILDYLPVKVKSVLKKSKYTYTESEQILLTLLAQIIVEIIIKEEL